MSKRRASGAVSSSAQVQGRVTVLGWEWALDVFARDPEARRALTVSLPDTLVCARAASTGGSEWRWLFTRKNGCVSKKKLPAIGTSTSADLVELLHKVRDRFVQVASRIRAVREEMAVAPPPYIATIFFVDDGQGGGTVKPLEPTELLDWLEILRDGGQHDSARRVLALQAFIPNHDDDAKRSSHISVRWEAPPAVPNGTLKPSAPSVRVERYEGHTKDSNSSNADSQLLPLELSPATQQTILQMVETVVASLVRAAVGRTISSVELVFTVDDAKNPWLRCISEIRVCGLSDESSAFASTGNKSTLPTLLQASADGDSVIDSTTGGAKCSGEFCRSALSSLPGLYRLCCREGDGLSSDPAAVIPDGGQRYKLGNNSILLAHAELSFLRGASSSAANNGADDEDSAIALQWQEADNVFRAELGRSQPAQFYRQVLVCANCHRVYSELNRVRELGFRRRPQSGHRSKVRGSTGSIASTAIGSASKRQASDIHSSVTSPADDLYDKQFMDELAKFSLDVDGQMAGNGTRHAGDVGPEQDEVGSVSGKRASVLPTIPPSLRGVGSNGMKPAKKAVIPVNNNNNQPQSSTDDAERSVLGARVLTLERQLSEATTNLETADLQRRKLEQEIVQTRSQCATMLKEKDEQHRRQMLERDLEFHTTKQQRVDTIAGASSAEEVARLIETIDGLNQQLDAANAARDQAERQLTQLHRAELKRVHEKYLVELDTLRLSEHTAKEQAEAIRMQMLTLQTQAQVAGTQARTATAALEDLTLHKLPALEEKNQRLERQLTELRSQQQQQQQATGMAKGAGSTSNATHELEALEKRMNNKIEYLKAQLSSELKCKEELGHHLAQITSALDQAKKDKKQAMLEQEEAFKRQLERAEATFKRDAEALSSQSANLQSKVVTLQANVTDLVQELALWKTKEGNARLAMEKAAEENVRVTRQLVDAEAAVEALQEEQRVTQGQLGGVSAKSASEETNRVQMEALLRRLDNERQYLKNQLDGEQDMKERSQMQVAALQAELLTLKDAMELAAQTFEQKMSVLAADKLREVQQLRNSLQCLDEEKQLVTRQLKEVQTKAAQLREQALLDREEVEKSRLEMNELIEQAQTAKEETVKEKEYARTASERMGKSLVAVKQSLQAVEQEKNLRIQRLEQEVAMYLGKLANAQGDALVRDENWSAERVAGRKESGLRAFAMALGSAATQWRTRALGRAFRHLTTVNAVKTLALSLQDRHASELEATEEQLREEFSLKCDQIAQSLHDERLDALRTMKEANDRDRVELHEFFEQEKRDLREELETAYATQHQQLELKFQQSANQTEVERAATIQTLQNEARKLQSKCDEAERVSAEWKQQCEQLEAQLSSEQERAESDRRRSEAERRDTANQAECRVLLQAEDLQIKLVTIVDRLVVEHSTSTAERESLHREHERERVDAVTAELSAAARAESERQEQLHVAAMAEASERHQEQLAEELEQVNARWQQEVQTLTESHAKQLDDAVARTEHRGQQQLEKLQRDMTERKEAAVLQCTSKWQRAMEELQERLDVDKQAAYKQGLYDREGEWQQAAAQIKVKQKEELESVQHEAVRAIQAAEERHRMQFQAKVAELTLELNAKREREVDAARQEITDSERRAAQAQLAAHATQLEEELTAKHGVEMEELRAQLTDEFDRERTTLDEKVASEKQELIEKQTQQREHEKAVIANEWASRLEAATAKLTADHSTQLEKLREELSDESDDAKQLLEKQFQAELSSQLERQRVELMAEQEDAIAQVQEDSEKLIEQVEHAMGELKKQKERLEQELVHLRTALEEAEDSQFDTREAMKQQRQHAAFTQLRLVALAHKKLRDAVEREASLQSSHTAAREQLQRDIGRERTQWQGEAAQTEAAWRQLRLKLEEMQQTLTSYKRDELVSHRSAGAVLANEIAIVTRQMDEVQETQAGLERDIAQLQAEAQGVEASLRQLMLQTSSTSATAMAGGGGSDVSLNMAVVAKKRRLNEEFEALLERIEAKKSELRAGEKTLAGLRSRRDDKERELKAMERKLVEILVQQQKQVLTLLATAQAVAPPTLSTTSSSSAGAIASVV